MTATAAVDSSDSVHPDADAIRRLGAPAEADRRAALDHLAERWFAHSLGMARGRVRRFFPGQFGSHLDDLAEVGQAQGWTNLYKRVLASPLTLSEPVDQTFEAFLRKCLGSAIIDHLPRTGSRVIPALRRLQRALPDPAQRQWLQQMIDQRRAGLRWDDPTELSRSTGIAEDVLARFLDEQVHPALARTDLAPPPEPEDPEDKEVERGDLLENLMQRVDEIFAKQPKARVVARAMLRVISTEPAVKGQWSVDHELLMEELDAMGQPWKSCRQVHAPGLPEARRCKQCASALHKASSRVTESLSENPRFQEARPLLRDEVAFRQVGSQRRQKRTTSRVSDDEGRDYGDGGRGASGEKKKRGGRR